MADSPVGLAQVEDKSITDELQPIITDIETNTNAAPSGIDNSKTSVAPTSANATSPSSNANMSEQAAATTSNTTDGASPKTSPLRNAANFAPPEDEPHPQSAEIIRQVEYYFSDENLLQDAHLLALTGEHGDGWVSLSEILGWKKMRQYKPKAKVKAALHLSDKLEIWKNKQIRRKEPLPRTPTVKPRIDVKLKQKQEQEKLLEKQPWMTKGMLKPTGFEATYAEPPLSPDEANEEGKLFDPEESFLRRIMSAVVRYESRRKMHQKSRQIFTRFLTYGGFIVGPNQFGGRKDKKELEDYTKQEIAEINTQFDIPEYVWDNFDPESDRSGWVVDFEKYAKAYLSCEFMDKADNWRDFDELKENTNLMRNFYNYLLYHDVCPEYAGQIEKAKIVCDMAEEEFPKLARFEDGLKAGGFNAACSVLHGGFHKSLQPWDLDAEYVTEHDTNFMPTAVAQKIFQAGVLAHCPAEEMMALLQASHNNLTTPVVHVEETGLEVVSIELASDTAKKVYQENTELAYFRPTGILHCVRWKLPNASPEDLPKDVIKERKAKMGEKLSFIMEEDTLRACVPGMKVDATIMQLETGLKWIDHFSFVFPSFYTWTLNEEMRGYKEPKMQPKAWMVNQRMKKASYQGGRDMEVVRAEGGDDEDPD